MRYFPYESKDTEDVELKLLKYIDWLNTGDN